MSVNKAIVSKEDDIFRVINESSKESSVYGAGYHAKIFLDKTEVKLPGVERGELLSLTLLRLI